uniref:OPA3-like protein n=1 Tax=Pyramimonas obovata TaxID=1411642 RepID=A0A7S0RJR8_9CHLO|mmetsp:Transcript_35721/g.77969  ORF Transcript_35721/g.77969 Transcript_35721/m.77969 type:complete len:165 (+) Transcript_35721:320-814(+)
MALSFKIGMLAVKTLAKPFANSIKSQAKSHPLFNEQLIAVAQKKHRATAWVTSALKPEGSPKVFAGKLSDDKALSQGTDLLGEFIIFSVAGVIVVYEYRRQQVKEAAGKRAKAEARARKENARDAHRAALETKLTALDLSLQELMLRVHTLEQRPPPRRSWSIF